MREIIKQVVLEQNNRSVPHKIIPRTKLVELYPHLEIPHTIILTGIRRCGKSTFLRQIISQYYTTEKVYYFNFEDERLIDFSSKDFNTLYEVLLERYGERRIFFLDEIQNVPKWELFVRRMMDKGFKFFITGSNASLLSQELGTRLTGRNIPIELYPFSFTEFLAFKQYKIDKDSLIITTKRAQLRKLFAEYLTSGGMPEYLQYKDPFILKSIYDDIIYRDIVARYEIKEIKIFRALSLYLISNIAKLYSYNGLKKFLDLGSMNTVKNYIHYLENSYLYFSLNRFSYSIKQQNIASRKIYCIDNGLVNNLAFQFSQNNGQYLENLIFLELKRRGYEIYYYNTAKNQEVDFLVRKGQQITELIQVATTLNNFKTKSRELDALVAAMDETGCKSGMILTMDQQDEIKIAKKTIRVVPVYKWLLSGQEPL